MNDEPIEWPAPLVSDGGLALMTADEVREGLGFDAPLMLTLIASRRLGPRAFSWEDGATFVLREHLQEGEVLRVLGDAVVRLTIGTHVVYETPWKLQHEPVTLTRADTLTVRIGLTVADL